MRRWLILLALGGILLLPPPLIGDPGRVQAIEDAATSRPDRAVHDVRRVEFAIAESHLVTTVRFARPLSEMMFEAAELYIDCDGSRTTGVQGADLLVRCAVGSRFHPNNWVPEKGSGLPAPLSQRTTAHALAEGFTSGMAGMQGTTFIWRGPLDPPTLGEKSFTFRTPLRLLRSAGMQYNRDVNVWMLVEGTCSEHPIPLVHRATDEGIPISLDGQDADWGGGTQARDSGGELHRDALSLDILKVQLEHRARELFVGIWMEQAGFARPARIDDVTDADEIVIAVEPLGAAYLAYEEHHLPAGLPSLPGARFDAIAKDRFVECTIPRPPEQTEFRVVVWSDAIRVDRVPDEGTFKLDTLPGRAR